jgi:hypothetical protein
MREGGMSYVRDWHNLFDLDPPVRFVSITTWNEWGEGTQIEPAKPYTVPDGQGIPDEIREVVHAAQRKFEDYHFDVSSAKDLYSHMGLHELKDSPSLYIDLTRLLRDALEKAQADKQFKEDL